MNGYDLLQILNGFNAVDGIISATKKEIKRKAGYGETWLMVRVRKLERTGFITWESQGPKGVAIRILKQPVFEPDILSPEWAHGIEDRIKRVENKMIDENHNVDYKSCWVILKRILKDPFIHGRIKYIGIQSGRSVIAEMAKIEMENQR